MLAKVTTFAQGVLSRRIRAYTGAECIRVYTDAAFATVTAYISLGPAASQRISLHCIFEVLFINAR